MQLIRRYNKIIVRERVITYKLKEVDANTQYTGHNYYLNKKIMWQSYAHMSTVRLSQQDLKASTPFV